MATKVLVFLESSAQYDAFCRAREADPSLEQAVFCALTPFALHLCEKHELQYVLPESSFTQAEYTACKKDSDSRIFDLIRRLNSYSSEAGLREVSFPVEIGHYFHGLLYTLVQSLHHRIFLLTRAINDLSPDLVLGFTASGPLQLYLDFLPAPNSDIYGRILKELSVDVPRRLIHCRAGDYQNRFHNWIRCLARKWEIIYKIHSCLKKRASFELLNPFSAWLSPRAPHSMLVIGPLYFFKGLMDHPAIRRKFTFSWLMGEYIPLMRSSANPMGLTADLLGWDDEFLGVRIGSLIGSQLDQIERTLAYCLKHYNSFKRTLAPYDRISSAIIFYPVQQFLAHIASRLGKPLAVWVHGSKGLIDQPKCDFAEDIQYARHVLTYGDGASRYYSSGVKEHPPFKGAVSIGMSSTDPIIRAPQKKDGYILYATGKYLLSITYMNPIMGPDNLLYRSQQRILSYLSDQRHREVLFKCNPTRWLGDIPADLHAYRANFRIQFVHFERSFTDLLPQASIVILDNLGTASLEAAATKIPLFILINRNKYRDDPMGLIKKRAVVTTRAEELVDKVELYFADNRYDADLGNNEFARAYATHLHDGHSADRAMEFFS